MVFKVAQENPELIFYYHIQHKPADAHGCPHCNRCSLFVPESSLVAFQTWPELSIPMENKAGAALCAAYSRVTF